MDRAAASANTAMAAGAPSGASDAAARQRAEDEALIARHRRARQRRAAWEAHWHECQAFALPQRGFDAQRQAGAGRVEQLYDGTAPDAVDQLAAALLGQLTPPWSNWFGLAPGREVPEADRPALAALLDDATMRLQSHFDRANFSVEIHQCYLDLATLGSASLLFQEAAPGALSAFQFAAVPLFQAVLEEGPQGRLDTTFRESAVPATQLVARFGAAAAGDEIARLARDEPDSPLTLIEAVRPDGHDFAYTALIAFEGDVGPRRIAAGRFAASPFINFRWQKAPGETYGRSPVMKALPDIKTANKIVELVLKNASIAVTGIWQADDDGVLNPANIRLAPGTIIPKAVGSAGLTPLEAPGRFDVSELMLQDLRGRIRHALMVDRLGQISDPRMTATEILERSAEMSRLLGATFGRLQSELLTPLVRRGIEILQRRGEIGRFNLDGRIVDLQYRSPLARIRAQADVEQTLAWLDGIARLGPEVLDGIDIEATVRWLAQALAVPDHLLRQRLPAAPGLAT